MWCQGASCSKTECFSGVCLLTEALLLHQSCTTAGFEAPADTQYMCAWCACFYACIPIC